MKLYSRLLFLIGLGSLNTLAYAMPVAASSPASWVQVIGALFLVIGLVLLCGWCIRRFGFGHKNSSNALLTVVSSIMVGQREKVLIVETDGVWLVLGVTSQKINLLHTMSARENAPLPPGSVPFAASLAQKLRDSLSTLDKKSRP